MSFQLQEWERGMSSMLLGSGRLAGLLPQPGGPACLGTSLPRCTWAFLVRVQRHHPWRGLEEQSVPQGGAAGASSAAVDGAGLWRWVQGHGLDAAL